MRSLLLDIVQGINTVYSGWILWNLFLAFVPLLLSFSLFRRGAVPPRWLAGAWGLTVAIGIIGLQARIPRVLRSVSGTWRDLQRGDGGLWPYVLWLAIAAMLALGLSLWRWRCGQTARPRLWWVGFAVFIAFLPNAPYVLTDIIHLIRGTSYGEIRVWVVALVLIPLHLCAILAGFEAYVMALLNVNYFLKAKRLAYLILPTELGLHALCALGIYLGRFVRLNSWDILLDPTSVVAITLNTLTSKRPVAVVVVTFVILTVLYWVLKQVSLGLKLRIAYARRGLDVWGLPE